MPTPGFGLLRHIAHLVQTCAENFSLHTLRTPVRSQAHGVLKKSAYT